MALMRGKHESSYINKILDGRIGSLEFDYADRVLCKLGKVDWWRTDPELSEIYQKINLRALDLLNPTTEKRAEAAQRYFTFLCGCLGVEQMQDKLKIGSTTITNLRRKFGIAIPTKRRSISAA